MIHSYYFSASGTTEDIVRSIAGNMGGGDDAVVVHHNLTGMRAETAPEPDRDDVVLFAAPVYGGRLPAMAAERFRRIRGAGQKCVAVVVYGNRDYEDALLELHDILSENGFVVVAAGAFVARHSIFPDVAGGRPDRDDLDRMAEFAERVRECLAAGTVLDAASVKGKRPYKQSGYVPLHPSADRKKCTGCGRCARECPAGAIYRENPYDTDAQKCVTCTRCIWVCPVGARGFRGLKYKTIAPIFRAMCAARREPERFVAEE